MIVIINNVMQAYMVDCDKYAEVKSMISVARYMAVNDLLRDPGGIWVGGASSQQYGGGQSWSFLLGSRRAKSVTERSFYSDLRVGSSHQTMGKHPRPPSSRADMQVMQYLSSYRGLG